MDKTKEQIIEELRERTKNFKSWQKVSFALAYFIESLWSFLKCIFFIIFELIILLTKAFLGFLFIIILFALGFSFLKNIIGTEPIIDLTK